ncbi:MAG: hypothetical protein NVSMB25_15160 [Thermoleophilaceae bacterium]
MRPWTAAALLVALALAVSAPATAARPAKGGRADSLELTFDGSKPGRTIPKDFLGLSFETKSLALIASYASDSNVPALLRSIGPGVMRFGGVTADTQVAWVDGTSPRPPWATTTVAPADMAALGTLANEADWRTLLAVNLGHYDADAAAREVLAAKRSLGPRLAGVQLGNEPDSYVRKGLRAEPWGYGEYKLQIDQYRAAIAALVPGIPLAGPDRSSSPRSAFLPNEAVDQHPALLTAHFYPLGCHDAKPPALFDLLSVRVRAAEQQALTRLAHISSAAGTPLRVDETNNVSCGGTAGISNTFASALWATDYLARAMSAGIAGINFHGVITNCLGYAPICASKPADLESGRLHANPEWYALLLAHQLIGDRALPTRTRPARPDVSATAFAGPGGRLQIVIVDGDSGAARPILAHLRVSTRYGGATVLRLKGPSLGATDGVSLGDRQVATDGTWNGLTHLPHVNVARGSLSVPVTPGSAALVTLLPHR